MIPSNQIWWGSGSGGVPVEMGELFNNDFTSLGNLDDFTQVKPNSTISLTGGYLRNEQNPGYGTFADYISYNGYGSTILEKWTMEAVIIPKNLTATSWGVSLGIKNNQASFNPNNILGFLELDNSVANGKLVIFNGGGALATSAGNLTYTLDDRIKLSYTRNAFTLSLTAENLTNPNTVTVSYNIPTNTYPYVELPPVIGKPSMFFSGGTQDVEYFKYSSTALKNADISFIGDSVTVAYGPSSVANRYADLIMSGSSLAYNVCASSGATTIDVLLCMNELLLLNSNKYVLCLSINDSSYGVPLATTKANFEYLINNLSGTKVLNYLIPYGGTDPALYNAMMDTVIGAGTIVDLTTALGTGTPKLPVPAYYLPDLIHPNDSGHSVISATYLAAGVI